MPYRQIAGRSAGTSALPLVHLRPPVWWPAILRSGLVLPPSISASSAWLANLSQTPLVVRPQFPSAAVHRLVAGVDCPR